MPNTAIQRLQFLCDCIPALLREIPDDEFSRKPAPGKWSKKQIIGHLIDSATNNHHRLVRAQFEESPRIVYDADQWNDANRYIDMPSVHIISFWEAYNRHLIEVVNRIPANILARTCTTEPGPVTLSWLVSDYVAHTEHHLHQVVAY